MFDRLTSRLQTAFRNLRGVGQLSEKNVQDALREVRLALLEADVHYATAKEFIERVKAKSLGATVLAGVAPGQQIIKAIHDELVALLGGEHRDFNLNAIPAEVMLLGLHGSGKTTTSGKLARLWKQKGKKVLLVACDIRRPAAVDQLEVLAKQAGAGIVKPQPGESVPDLGRRAFQFARQNYYDIVLYDTGGRFQIDEELVAELQALRAATEPQNVVLVLDAAIGQESVNVAKTFHDALGLTGLILTKLDGDTRGGAALSVVAVTGCPILRVGTGERPEDLEVFHPDRMASRILGMGDVVSLVEKVQETMDVAEAEKIQAKFKSKEGLDLNDFLAQMRQIKKMGSLGKLMEMLPGAGAIAGDIRNRIENDSGDQMKKFEAIVLSMTPRERRHPDLLNGSRRKRVAKGAGVHVSDVNTLLRNFRDARQMAKRMQRLQKRLPRGGLFR
ncbi:MAG TPA: signal recognition particle protein [Kiritimatiellia bacterium]|jgi:signal recognition particle subunit SRP54|nr:signal recognition particle protein [Kiritimatiellia bacterium]OQC57344.1 MAG: Signal recognition particle protein [Verrucomicrobia bacterium ADurb.Bin018]MBP9572792.1 signal recognition particle protein [Kiritimatiellia bacterium]HOD99867.1 signal recognition particle protein [Kiritimatiellia bacterium]HOE37854.1 signal recognition particle protein [Kiritimatiellia bacterium]